jgi:anthranilate phosphoribosyltransferase
LAFVLGAFIERLNARVNLDEQQVTAAVAALTHDDVPVETKAEFLAALADKGETIEEIAAFARELRSRAIQPPIDPATRKSEILDVCGMGGDRLNTFNISTSVALIVAAARVPVAKHGNRAITSQSGSADVLDALGVPIDLPPVEAARSLQEHNFAFFFAPQYHPAFKQIAPARKLCAARGQRTIFNVLGPLLNPAAPSVQLVGVPAPDLCEQIGRVLQALGLRRAMVVCGQAGNRWLDELSTLGGNLIAEFYQQNGFTCGMADFPGLSFQSSTIEDLAGGDRRSNAEIIRRLLNGTERGPKRDAVLLNAGAALFVANKTRSLLEGWEMAEELLDSGQAAKKLGELVTSR